MTREEYGKTPARKLIGRKVRTKVPLSNQLATIPAGTLWTIWAKHAGFSLRSDACDSCGVSVSITKVQPQQVELLEGEN